MPELFQLVAGKRYTITIKFLKMQHNSLPIPSTSDLYGLYKGCDTKGLIFEFDGEEKIVAFKNIEAVKEFSYESN